jgi:cation transport regulator ChaC
MRREHPATEHLAKESNSMSRSHIWYFAYGVNMNREVLESRGVQTSQSLKANVPGMRLAFEMVSLYRPGTGDATIRPLRCNEERVPVIWGVLHRIPLASLNEQLDHWEAVHLGHYQRREVEAVTCDGTRVKATTYAALHLNQCLRPSKEYLVTILAGAEAFGLPKDYLTFLRNHPVEEKYNISYQPSAES